MTIAARFVVVSALVLLAGSAAFAQPPTAPPPHPPLRELAKEYVRLGLPLPPPDAPLVRIRQSIDDGTGAVTFAYELGLRITPATPGRDPRYLIGDGWRRRYWIDPNRVESVAPTTEALADVQMEWNDPLLLAVQCQLRGWDELSNSLYSRVRKGWESQPDELRDLLIHELREWSFGLSMDQVFQPHSDRGTILRQLKARIAEDKELASKEDIVRIRRLELALAKEKARPDPVEALIDGLVDYWQEVEYPPSKSSGDESYWKLAEMGFDAVPALIEHLNDDRLTRTTVDRWIVQINAPYDVTVGLLCTWLLEDLSGMEIGKDLDEGAQLKQEVARAWFETARKTGEEKYLLAHVFPRNNSQPTINKRQNAEAHLFRVIGVKYPARVPELYHAKLKQPWSQWPQDSDHIEQIVGCKLPRDAKIALFEEGLRQKDTGHRMQALEGLAQLDKPLFNQRLLQVLEESIASIKKGGDLTVLRFSLAPIVKRSDDQRCWNAYLTAAKASAYDRRIGFIRAMVNEGAPDDSDPRRRERLLFFMAFLDDRTTEPDDPNAKPDEEQYRVQVRDYASSMLADMFRFPVPRHDPPDYFLFHNYKRGPLTRLLLREAVRELARRELKRLPK